MQTLDDLLKTRTVRRAAKGARERLSKLDAFLDRQVLRNKPKPAPRPPSNGGSKPPNGVAEKVGIASCNWDGYVEPVQSKLPMLGNDALEKLCRDYEFETILDLGAGAGLHTTQFKKRGRKVTSLDISASKDFEPDLVGDYMQMEFDPKFDCVWCSHVLEHVPNVRTFLEKIVADVKVGGYIAITVPPAKHEVVAGHVTIWNAGLLLYNLVLVGLDCSEAAVATYGYNVSVIVQKKPITKSIATAPFKELNRYFPVDAPSGFDGRIGRVNW